MGAAFQSFRNHPLLLGRHEIEQRVAADLHEAMGPQQGFDLLPRPAAKEWELVADRCPAGGGRCPSTGFMSPAISTPTRYADLRRSFIERYGPPTRAETKKRVGPFSEHLSEEVLWDGPTVHIKLAQYVGGPTLSVAVISLRSEVDRRAAEPDTSTAPTPHQK